MKLQQNQLWRQGDTVYRIVRLERLSVDFKEISLKSPDEGNHHTVTKKEFCRLIKGATEIREIPS